MLNDKEQFKLTVYLGEIERQCAWACKAYEHIRLNLEKAASPSDIFFYVSAFLSHVANISKLMDGTKGRGGTIERGRWLRECLGITDLQACFAREVRNGFEHFDERLDELFANAASVVIVDSNVMPAGAIHGLDATKFLRHLAPETLTVSIQGTACSLTELHGNIISLKAAVQGTSQRIDSASRPSAE